jgi:hypothetical protein
MADLITMALEYIHTPLLGIIIAPTTTIDTINHIIAMGIVAQGLAFTLDFKFRQAALTSSVSAGIITPDLT